MQSDEPGSIHPEIVDARLDDPMVGAAEDDLWHRVREDPNDRAAFSELVELMRRRGVARHGEGDEPHVADDATWALAEELAHSARAWYPLVELARLSMGMHHEGALSRLTTAVSRDPSGQALEASVDVLRESGTPQEAHAFGVGHWRPTEHVVGAGRSVILAAIEADRPGDVHAHWVAMLGHPDTVGLAQVQRELAERVEEILAAGPRTGGLQIDLITDLRDRIVLPRQGSGG